VDRKSIESLFSNIGQLKCLVIGDLMLDEYLWGKTDRISPEAPVQVVDVVREEMRLGGAGNVVNNLVALGAQVSVCSVIGQDQNGQTLLNAFRDRSVSVDAILLDPQRHTSKKTRVVASNQQIVRIDRESRETLSEKFEQQLCNWIKENVHNFNVVLLSDYLKGVLTNKVIEAIISTASQINIPVLVDPKGSDYSRYKGATILTPNRKEAEAASGIAIVDKDSLSAAASIIIEKAGLKYLLITRSEEGMSLFSLDKDPVHIPTVAREVFDVSGAGDTVLASIAIGIAAGMEITEAAGLANVAAGIAVSKLGTSIVTPAEIINAVALTHSDSDSKIKNRDVLAAIVGTEKAKGKTIVFTNGCFDLLHAGHVKYLQKARCLGDMLILGLNSDASVRRLKGDSRPLIDEDERAHILAALNCIDYVVIFEGDTPLDIITQLKPHILVKGGDYTAEDVVGKDIVESYGGRVELVNFVDGKSTTNIIERILERYS